MQMPRITTDKQKIPAVNPAIIPFRLDDAEDPDVFDMSLEILMNADDSKSFLCFPSLISERTGEGKKQFPLKSY